MAKISTYPFPSPASASDYVIGTDANDALATKNFLISDILALGGPIYVPYTNAINDVDLGTFSLYTYSLYMNGGPIWDGNGSPGSSGQILSSQGPGSSPVWIDAPITSSPVYGSFYSNGTQTNIADETTALQFNITNVSNGITIGNDGFGNPTKITFSESGVYNIQFSAQLVKTGGIDGYIIMYLVKNGTPIPNTSFYLSLINNDYYTIESRNYFVNLNLGDFVEIFWYSSSDNIQFESIEYVGIPNVPSTYLTVNKIS